MRTRNLRTLTKAIAGFRRERVTSLASVLTLLLLRDGPRTMSDLAVHNCCSPANMTGVRDRLQEAGLVDDFRVPDRRLVCMELTGRGRELVDRVLKGKGLTP